MSESSGQNLSEEVGPSALIYNLLAVIQNPFGVIRRRWVWMSLVIVLGLGAAAGLYTTSSPSYSATATVMVSSQQIPEEFVRSTVSGLDSMAEINSLLGEAFSQKFLLSLVEEYELYPDVLAASDAAFVAALMRSTISVNPQDNLASSRRQREDPSVIIAIGYETSDPRVAAFVTNALAANVIDASIARRSAQARGTTSFLQRELRDAKLDLDKLEDEIGDFRNSHRGEMPADLETLLRKLERLDSQRNSLRVQISATQEQITQIENAEGVESSPETVLTDLRIQLAQQLSLHTDAHPNVLALRRQIEAMEDELGELNQLLLQADEGSDYLVDAARRELASLRGNLESTGEEIAALELRVARIPDISDELRSLQERAAVSRENYLEFLRKVQDAELAETLESAQQGPRVSVLDPAFPPSAPNNPPSRYLLLGMVLSLMAGAGVGVLLELVDPVVLTQAQLEAVQGLPVLGTLGRIK